MSDDLGSSYNDHTNGHLPATRLRDIQNIARLPKGFLVRFRQSPEAPIQVYFAHRQYGGEVAALTAAIEKRDELRADFRARHRLSRRNGNRKNRSGILGVAWCLFPEGNGGVRQAFRAQSATIDFPGKPAAQSFAVKKFGLWRAYCMAARWRYKALGESAALREAVIAERFSDYLQSCREEISVHPERALALQQALEEAVANENAPEEVKVALRACLSGLE